MFNRSTSFVFHDRSHCWSTPNDVFEGVFTDDDEEVQHDPDWRWMDFYMLGVEVSTINGSDSLSLSWSGGDKYSAIFGRNYGRLFVFGALNASYVFVTGNLLRP